MSRLYERFVARWLEAHLPVDLRLEIQENIRIGDDDRINVNIDLVLYDSIAGVAVAVLDTKYKAAGSLSNADLFQIVAYANVKTCSDAILVYPIPLNRPIGLRLGEIAVRNLTFGLEGSLDENGARFVAELTRQPERARLII